MNRTSLRSEQLSLTLGLLLVVCLEVLVDDGDGQQDAGAAADGALQPRAGTLTCVL